MDILLCWSKERSKLVARALHEWLPKVLPGVKPWMSELDLEKGKDWFDQLHDFFAEARAAIVCITPENVRSPWIYYESGQIAGRLETNLVCPYLLEEQPSILSDGPLGRIQATKAEKEDTLRLLRTLNKHLGGKAIRESDLDVNFEREWSSIAGTLRRVAEMRAEPVVPNNFIKTDIDQLAGGDLSSEERTLILECGQDRHGSILHCVTSGGYHFQTNGKELNNENTARSTARWKAALKSLVQRRFLEMRGRKGEMFALTDKGFEIFDALKKASDE
jgi:hypothetical protein